MQVDYSSEFNPQKSIIIKDIGNCAIEGINPDGLYFYMIITAIRGEVVITTFGPVIPGIYELPNGYSLSHTRTYYKPGKIKSAIFSWLNKSQPGKNKAISEAKEITKKEALDNFRDINEYYYNDDDLSERLDPNSKQNLDEEDDDF